MSERFKNWKPPAFDNDGWAYPSVDDMMFKQHKYGWRCLHHEKLKLGKNVDIGCFCFLNAEDGIEIGDNVQLGSHCSVYSVDSERDVRGKVIICENVLIGAHSVILPGVMIAKGRKIRIGSVII